MVSRFQMTVANTHASAQKFGMDFLIPSGSPTPGLDSRLLLQAASGLSHEALVSRFNETVPWREWELFRSYLERRRSGEPVHRIIGKREFFGREFIVSEDTLVPRPETEFLVEATLRHLPSTVSNARLLEIGTGTGVVVISIALETGLENLVATDVSEGALFVAKRNAIIHGVQDAIQFEHADVFEGIDGVFDLIVSNPPYIPSGHIAGLDDTVKMYDPVLSLNGGHDGLDFYRAIFDSAQVAVKAGGLLVLEMGYDQRREVAGLGEAFGFDIVEVVDDLCGIERILVARKNEADC